MYICLPILFFIQNVGVAFNVTGSREFFLYHRYHLHGGLQCKLNVTFMFRSFVINVHYNYIFFAPCVQHITACCCGIWLLFCFSKDLIVFWFLSIDCERVSSVFCMHVELCQHLYTHTHAHPHTHTHTRARAHAHAHTHTHYMHSLFHNYINSSPWFILFLHPHPLQIHTAAAITLSC